MNDTQKTARLAVEYEVFLTRKGRVSIARSFEVSPSDIGVYTNEDLEEGEQVELVIVPAQGMLNIEIKGTVRYRRDNPDKKVQPHKYQAGIEFLEEEKENLPFLEIQGKIRHYQAAHTLAINDSAQKCYALLADFEKYPRWASVLEQVKILEKYPDGRGKRVEFVMNLVIRKVTYILDYAYDDENYCLSWVDAGGDALSITGRYFFKPLGDKLCSSTYELDIKADIVLPNRLMRYFSGIAMRKTMKEFKSFVEGKP